MSYLYIEVNGLTQMEFRPELKKVAVTTSLLQIPSVAGTHTLPLGGIRRMAATIIEEAKYFYDIEVHLKCYEAADDHTGSQEHTFILQPKELENEDAVYLLATYLTQQVSDLHKEMVQNVAV